MRGHFAEAGHQEVDHQADQRIGQQRTAGTRGGHGGAGRDEQAGADGAADGDHVQVAGFEGAVQAILGGSGAGDVQISHKYLQVPRPKPGEGGYRMPLE
ncbi:hypothetical protein D9M71_214500 [compost metagenome]